MVAADQDKKKAMSDVVKRALISESRRMYNKSRKSACSTRMKKVFRAAEALKANLPSSEDELKLLEQLVNEAFTELDKAVVKGVLHANVAARRKSRVSRAKRDVLMLAGLYKPAPEDPAYGQYLRLQPAAAASSS